MSIFNKILAELKAGNAELKAIREAQAAMAADTKAAAESMAALVKFLVLDPTEIVGIEVVPSTSAAPPPQ